MIPVTFITDRISIREPTEAHTFDGFRAWVGSPDAPEYAPITFVRGHVWVDLADEDLFSHNSVRVAIGSELHQLSKLNRTGHFYGRGAFWSNREADAAGNPDGLYISNASLQTRRIRRLPEGSRECDELEGSPDMVLEVVSKSSVKKDTEILFEAYWEAGIGEYWLVDARSDAIAFDIYKRGPKGLVATRQQAGWLKSVAFGKAFKLTRENDDQGNPEFTLHVK